MMNKNWLTRLVTVSACSSSKFRLRRRRASQMWCMDEQLEARMLLSGQNLLPNLTGFPGASEEEEGEDVQADEPVEVTGSFLTSQSAADSKPMFFNDVAQGQLDTCVFAATLSSVAMTDFNLANSLILDSQTTSGAHYRVRLWARDVQNQNLFVPYVRAVYFDFKFATQDL